VRTYFVYVLANEARRLYVGVTRDLERRLWEHKSGSHDGYTAAHGVTKLVYFEAAQDVRTAIAREKQLKRWPRARKVRLIEDGNAGWLDLAIDWYRSQPTRRTTSTQRPLAPTGAPRLRGDNPSCCATAG